MVDFSQTPVNGLVIDKSALIKVMVWCCQTASDTSTKNDHDLWRHMTSFGHDKLTDYAADVNLQVWSDNMVIRYYEVESHYKIADINLRHAFYVTSMTISVWLCKSVCMNDKRCILSILSQYS